MGCIYRIICHVTGKSYVGQTSYSQPFIRFREHRAAAERGEEGPLYDDMRKYDICEFECQCICVTPNKNLNSLECYYAEQYNAYVCDGGYNVSECGRVPVRPEMDDTRRAWIKRRAIFKRIHK